MRIRSSITSSNPRITGTIINTATGSAGFANSTADPLNGFLFDEQMRGAESMRHIEVGVTVPWMFTVLEIPDDGQVQFYRLFSASTWAKVAGDCCIQDRIVPIDLGEVSHRMSMGGSPWVLDKDTPMGIIQLEGSYMARAETKDGEPYADSIAFSVRYSVLHTPTYPFPREYILGMQP